MAGNGGGGRGRVNSAGVGGQGTLRSLCNSSPCSPLLLLLPPATAVEDVYVYTELHGASRTIIRNHNTVHALFVPCNNKQLHSLLYACNPLLP